MSSIPEELRSLRQWTYSYSETELKRPTHYHYSPDGALSFEQAVEKAGTKRSYGLYVTKDDPYILGDIDHIDDPYNPYSDLPISFVSLLRDNPTYMEVSPSGHGIRFVYKLLLASEKQTVDGFYFKNKIKMGQDSEGATREAQINVGRPWQRFTGNKLHDAPETIAVARLSDFEEVFKLRHETTKTKDLAARNVDPSKLPPFDEVIKALTSIPLDQNPRVQRAYESTFMESYTHYGFWLKILMALHNYAELSTKNIECLDAAIEWSKTDPTDYTGEETVHKHWRSFTISNDYISYKSLFGVAHKNRLFWPRPKKAKSGDTFYPMISEYVNFLSLIDYYAIRFFREETNYSVVYVTADKDIIEKYFMMVNVEEWYGKFYGPFSRDTLVPALYRMCQDAGFFGLSHNIAMQFVKTYLAETKETINLVRYYFDTPFDRLPAKYKENEIALPVSTVEYLFSALDIDYVTEETREEEEKLYFAYYRSWLMGLVRNMYMNDDIRMNNCILLLTGKEQIRKTSHFKFLFPSFLRDKIAFTTHGFDKEASMRDVVKLSSTNLMLVWDEIEQYLNDKSESNFKKIIDNNPQKIIDKYETVEKVITPIAVYGGTSNRREFRLGSDGSRRIFNIPVKWVDTDLINSICWHGLINSLKKEIQLETRKGRVPWLLTEEQLQFQRKLHARLRSRTTIELLLEEIFHFEESFGLVSGDVLPNVRSFQNDKTRLFTTKDICEILISKGHSAHAARRPAVIRSLTRLCSNYTNTEREEVTLVSPRCVIRRGEAKQGIHKKWVLPPMRLNSPGAAFSAHTKQG